MLYISETKTLANFEYKVNNRIKQNLRYNPLRGTYPE